MHTKCNVDRALDSADLWQVRSRITRPSTGAKPTRTFDRSTAGDGYGSGSIDHPGGKRTSSDLARLAEPQPCRRSPECDGHPMSSLNRRGWLHARRNAESSCGSRRGSAPPPSRIVLRVAKPEPSGKREGRGPSGRVVVPAESQGVVRGGSGLRSADRRAARGPHRRAHRRRPKRSIRGRTSR